MADLSRRQAALADLVNRLGYITVANGYQTDAGAAILLGEAPRFGPSDPTAAILVTIGDDAPSTEGGLTRTVVPFDVWAVVAAGAESPLTVIEAVLADIKRAVEIEGPDGARYLGTRDGGTKPASLPRGLMRGTSRGARREEGTNYIGASVEYLVTFEEPWGTP